MAEILVTEAALRTLSVTIESLTVSGKQMTLAVFRQLPDRFVCDSSLRLRPVRCWGLVRYSIKDEGSLWVVFEEGGILYRSEFPSQRYEERYSEEQIAGRLAGEKWREPSAAEKEKREREAEAMRRENDKWRSLAANSNAARAELAKLPQLFIAV